MTRDGVARATGADMGGTDNRFEGSRQPSSRPLRSDENELCELICTWFVVVEVEGLVEAGLNITPGDRLKFEPEGLNGVGDRH
jgi:hypothetical protein